MVLNNYNSMQVQHWKGQIEIQKAFVIITQQQYDRWLIDTVICDIVVEPLLRL